MNEFGEKPVDRVLRSVAVTHFADVPNVARSLLLVSEHPSDFAIRVTQFDEVIKHLNFLRANAEYEPIDANFFRGVIDLNRKLWYQPLPTLKELAEQCSQRSRFMERVFTEISRKITSRNGRKSWSFATKERNHNILASGLLIEGYGLLAERHFRKRGLARIFVLGFEEVLLAKAKYDKTNPPVELFEDIKSWMIDEIVNFSPAVQTELQQLQQLP